MSVTAPDAPGAKRAALRWRAVAHRADRKPAGRTLLDIDLETGRKHQIRVQLAALGTPVVGDFRYGDPAEPFADGRGIALHAYALTLEHPTRRERMTFTAPPPPAWAGLFDAEVARVVGRGGAG